MGLAVDNGVLEVTHAFPTPAESNKPTNDDDDDDDAVGFEGHEFQLEMMRMLREVNVDNNCVGWYQCMYLGIYSTSSLLDNQLSYQMDLSPNAVVILYDPMQTSYGNLVLKCYRLSDAAIRVQNNESDNSYINPKEIFEEVPIELTNPGLVQALLMDIEDGVHPSSSQAVTQGGVGGYGLYDTKADTTFDRLDLSTNPYLEKHLEFLCGWVDDLAAEQQKFQYYSRQLARSKDHKQRSNKKDSWNSSDAPRRMESLLISNQIRSYCDQMDKFASGGLSKLFLAGGLHKDTKSGTE